MNYFKSAFFLYVLVCSSLAFSEEIKTYNCEWKAIRSTKNPNFSPYGGNKDPGKVTVSEDLVSYGSVKFKRSRAVPPQKRSNGTVNIIYSDGEDMVNMAYAADGKVHISLMQMSAETNLVGDCSPYIEQKKVEFDNKSSRGSKFIRVGKGEDYNQIRKKLIANGWQSFDTLLDKSSQQRLDAIRLNKLFGFFELTQCFGRGKNSFSCDVAWTSTGNRDNPELFMGILINVDNRSVVIEADAASK